MELGCKASFVLLRTADALFGRSAGFFGEGVGLGSFATLDLINASLAGFLGSAFSVIGLALAAGSR